MPLAAPVMTVVRPRTSSRSILAIVRPFLRRRRVVQTILADRAAAS
jgi:hypothetical protein